MLLKYSGHVALRKESVDRNFDVSLNYKEVLPSLSARRAWIEIGCFCRSGSYSPVALRKESVDRNINQEEDTRKTILSLSARRAWIEIVLLEN